MNAIPSKNGGVFFDTGHFDAAGVDMYDLIDKLSDRINHIHLKENDGFGIKKFTRFGEGTTDNHGIVKKMIECGYEGYMSVEISPEIGENGGDTSFSIEDLAKPVMQFSKYEK